MSASKSSAPGAIGRDQDFVVMKGVSKRYGSDTVAVRDLDLTIAKGEFLTLLGPSGSGKTTSLMMLAGFETPTTGEIRLAGASVERTPAHRRNIGVVFQNYALFPHMTVRENIAFPLSVRHFSRKQTQTQIDRVLDLVRMRGFADRHPIQLSGGQQQRVALARALVFNPPLVLMDEPLGALDRQLREQLQVEIKNIHSHLGVTLVYVTHDQSEALTMSDRVAVFRDGAVQQIATPVELYEHPRSAFVARFIGESVQIAARLIAREGAYCCVEMNNGRRINAFDALGTSAESSGVTLSIRPERLVLNPRPGEYPEMLDGTIEEVIYHGDFRRVRVRVWDGQNFIVKVPNDDRAMTLERGAAARIGWRPCDWRALDALDDAPF